MNLWSKTVRKLSVLRLKLAMWGVKGVFDWLLRQGRTNREHRWFLANARRHPYSTPERGITIVGSLSTFGSLSKVLRDFAFALKDAGIPFQSLDTGNGVQKAESAPILTPSNQFRIGRFSHSVEMIATKIPDGIVHRRAKIMFWEFNEGMCEGYPCLLDNNDDMIAMSDFNFEYFRRTFGPHRTIHKIPYPLRIDVSGVACKAACRAKFGLPQKDFIAFYNFNYNSGFHRKNPIGVLKAFAAAFRSTPDARLVLKTLNAGMYPSREETLLRLAESEGIRDRLVLFNDGMPQRDVYELTNTCDVYCSLHRAEGFGLGIAEAMSLSKAVVATNYSATKEFCHPQHSLLVPFRMSEVSHDEIIDMPSYRWCRFWAEPDIGEAARALRLLYENPMLCERLGNDARHFIKETYSIDNFKKAVDAFLST